MKYAVVQSGSKQFKVSEGDVIAVDNLSLKADETYVFPQVLLIVDGDKREVGTPVIEGAKVTAKVVGSKKGEKVRVAKFKAKARYRRVTGFRASLTEVKIEAISAK